eukprot:TRINITY_DN11907_c0_g1_i1.p1 TRINITY_DN11907_c0_g1~~TRINITY_DN11907_c0_g1_i1.p1  ORF type:complete len:356 (+),score=35.36 TRINITY_DN11907_c0_g1_i1:134-1201(+)
MDVYRRQYLRKIGFQTKPRVDDSALDSLFKCDIIDIEKLETIVRRYEIPANYRARIWKIQLGVLSKYKKSWKFITQQRAEEFYDLQNACRIIFPLNSSLNYDENKTNNNTRNNNNEDEEEEQEEKSIKSVNNINVYTDAEELNIDTTSLTIAKDESRKIMEITKLYSFKYHLSSLIGTKSRQPVKKKIKKNLIDIVRVFVIVCDNIIDAYWCYTKFIEIRSNRYVNETTELKILTKILISLLQKIDKEYYDFLISPPISLVFYENFCLSWFSSYFASCLQLPALLKIWDYVINFSDEYLSYFAVCLLLILKPQIKSLSSKGEIINILLKPPTIDENELVIKTLEIYDEDNPSDTK